MFTNTHPFENLPTTPFYKADKIENALAAIGKCIEAALPAIENIADASAKRQRRTDREFSYDATGTDRNAKEFQHKKLIPLSAAINCAENSPGVYVLYLNGVPMKCGRAAYDGGIAWRLRQYYNLNYDDRARKGECWSVSKENRDSVLVSWQCCPAAKCQELEYKLFQKYGKGPWAKRAPVSCETNSWELLI